MALNCMIRYNALGLAFHKIIFEYSVHWGIQVWLVK